MTSLPRAETYTQAQELARAGRAVDALACLREYLLRYPRDGRALNDAGVILAELGSPEEAAGHLIRALHYLTADRVAPLRNLAELYLQTDRPAAAAGLMGPLLEAGEPAVDLTHRIAEAFVRREDPSAAVEVLLLAGADGPDRSDLAPIYERIRGTRPKVALIGQFAGQGWLARLGDYVERRFPARLADPTDRAALPEILRESDIAWFDNCPHALAVASRLPKRCRIICRLDREALDRCRTNRIEWRNVDVVLASGSRHVADLLRGRLEAAVQSAAVLRWRLAVDMDWRLPMPGRAGKALACVGKLDLGGNTMGLLQCFAELHAADPECRLFIEGCFEEDRLEYYLRCLVRRLGIAEAVSFDGYQTDLAEWLVDKQYVVSAAIDETSAQRVLQAMFLGLKRLVHVFPGADDLFLPEHLYATCEEFRRRILHQPHRPAEYRRFVARRYSLRGGLFQAGRLLAAVEKYPLPGPLRLGDKALAAYGPTKARPHPDGKGLRRLACL